MSRYFDYAAATPMHPSVLQKMQPYFSDYFYNPGAIYLSAIQVKKDLTDARATIAKSIGAKPTEIVFTAGGTEANNLAIAGIMRRYPKGEVLVSAIEHDSVRVASEQFTHSEIPVTKNGRISIDALSKLVTDNTVLISCMLVNNEIGTIQDIAAIVTLVEQIKKQRLVEGNTTPLFVHTDACQAINYMDISVARLGVDLLTLNSGKIYGPKQCGVLYVKTGTSLEPIVYGGGQEKGLRSGTENVANCIGMAEAMRITDKMRLSETKRVIALRDMLIDRLSGGARISINGTNGTKRIANNVHITVDGYDNERLLMELDMKGCMVATGSACSASSDLPSHVLKAIGLTDEQSRNSLRITLGRQTNEDDITYLSQNILELVAKK